MDIAEAGDFVYVDPPYAPVSPSANFTSYTATGFSAADQQRLQRVVIAAVRRGCQVLLSNSMASNVVDLYGTEAARAAGLRTLAVPARRAMNSNAAKRGPVQELLVTNIAPAIETSVREC
jgi:DNA adenine methylase